MKRFFITCLLASPALVATGCPMYDDTGCESELDCGSGYECHLLSGACVREDPHDGVTRCDDDDDCKLDETCDRFGRCVEQAAGGAPGAAGAATAGGVAGASGVAGVAGASEAGGASGAAGAGGDGGLGGAGQGGATGGSSSGAPGAAGSAGGEAGGFGVSGAGG